MVTPLQSSEATRVTLATVDKKNSNNCISKHDTTFGNRNTDKRKIWQLLPGSRDLESLSLCLDSHIDFSQKINRSLRDPVVVRGN